MWWHDIAIDLGTTNSRIYTRERGLILREPSAVAIRRPGRQAIAFGEQARTMLGRVPGYIEVIRPLSDGVITHFDATKELLRHLVREAGRGHPLQRKALLMCITLSATHIETEALLREAEAAGADRVEIIRTPLAAAVGAGMPIHEPRGNLLIDLGGGTTEVMSLSLSEVVHCESLRVGGDEMDQAVQSLLRSRYSFAIGDNTAERIKIWHGAVHDAPGGPFEVKGLNQRSGKPQRICIHPSEVQEALEPVARQITDAVRRCLERLTPDLAIDVFQDGAVLLGGGALLHGWPQRLQATLGLRAYVAESPQLCAIRGLSEILLRRERYGSMILRRQARQPLLQRPLRARTSLSA